MLSPGDTFTVGFDRMEVVQVQGPVSPIFTPPGTLGTAYLCELRKGDGNTAPWYVWVEPGGTLTALPEDPRWVEMRDAALRRAEVQVAEERLDLREWRWKHFRGAGAWSRRAAS